MFRSLTSDIIVSPQIGFDAVAEARDLGVALIINNRPEGESEDQIPGADIEAAARAAGLDYVAIPITHSGFSEPQVNAMAEALAGAKGKVLAYCRSGTRSTLLWALAESAQGGDPDALTNMAAKAGYDVSPVRPLMDMLKARRG
ncbi:MAG: TIGR01244 family sulfur transferase [Chakrabartia sp.]